MRAAVLTLLLSTHPACASAATASNKRPDVILISIDTLRPDRTGCYGYRRATTPNLDAFAKEAVVFENAISAAPWTLPSHTSMFTSLYPNRHGLVQHPKPFSVRKNLKIAYDIWHAEGWPGLTARFLKEPRVKPHKMDGRVVTLAEKLRQEGYRTAGFAAADTLDGSFGFARGFDVYDDAPFRPAPRQNELALDWLADAKDKPSFLFLHYYDAHGNFGRDVKRGSKMGGYPVYDAPPEVRALFDDGRRGRFDGRIKSLLTMYRGEGFAPVDVRTLNALYDAGVRETDRHLGDFLARLKEMGRYKDAIILVTSDHGENLLDESGEILHHTGLRNSLLRVVCVLKPAGEAPAPRRVPSLVRTIDYMPTLLEGAGAVLEPALRRQMQGLSLLGPLRSGRFPQPSAYSEVDITGYGYPPAKAIQDAQGWKLVYHPATHAAELYDLRNDPLESRDVADRHPEKSGRLLEDLMRHSGVMRPDARAPNIVLVSIDNLRADHLGSYGYRRNTSPCLDALAKSATLFEKNISPSAWTLPAHMSLLTSLYPSYHGLTMEADAWSPRRWTGALSDGLAALWSRALRRPVRYGPAFQLNRLRPGLRLLPEELKASGYRTGAFVAASYLSRRNGFARGFDRFVNNPEDTPAARQNEAALAWVSGLPGPPFFLFLHYYDLHHTLKGERVAGARRYPYDCPGPFQKEFLRAAPADFDARFRGMPARGMRAVPPEDRRWIAGLYDGCVKRVDADLGDLLSRLDSLGLSDSTLLVVTSDHGEEFWEHGGWGHGRGLFQELIHTPLIIKGPGQKEARRVRTLSSGVDILPTLLEEAGLAPSVQLSAQMQGSGLRPLEARRQTGAVYSERDHQAPARAAFTPDGWKLISTLDTRQPLLFDLDKDPAETKDLGASRPGRLGELEELLSSTYSGPPEH